MKRAEIQYFKLNKINNLLIIVPSFSMKKVIKVRLVFIKYLK